MRFAPLIALLGWPTSSFAEVQMPAPDELALYAGAALAGLLLLAVIFRPVVCWYLRINERLSLLNEIGGLLKEVLRRMEADQEARRARTPEPEVTCPQCHSRYPAEMRGRYCDKCGARL
jgi:hypothetical protein